MEQSEAIGLGAELKSAGYGLICIGRAQSSLILETQDEDEVYELQFGRHLRRSKRRWFSFALPWGND
jgi:ferredoxin